MPGKWSHRLASNWALARACASSYIRCYTTNARILRGNDLGPTRKDGNQSFRIRIKEDGKDLPLPPALDPVVIEKKSSWVKPKAQPNAATSTPFQKKLLANPYAHALASPVRQCRATSISLPVDFLTTLHARPHPTTNDPWLLPVALTTNKKSLGPPYQFIERYNVVNYLGKKKLWEKGLYSRMFEKHGHSNMQKAVWREDLADLTLDLMQKLVIKKLRWAFGFRGRLTPVASPRSEDIESIGDVSCVLFVDSLRTRADNIHDSARKVIAEMDKWSSYVAKSFVDKLDPHASPRVTHSSPVWYVEPVVPRLQARAQFPELEFKSTIWRGKRVAVYSLTDLLGKENTQDLMQGSKYGGQGSLVITQARHNVPVEILLMRLQAYLAQPGP